MPLGTARRNPRGAGVVGYASCGPLAWNVHLTEMKEELR